jgi:hypothetical protein
MQKDDSHILRFGLMATFLIAVLAIFGMVVLMVQGQQRTFIPNTNLVGQAAYPDCDVIDSLKIGEVRTYLLGDVKYVVRLDELTNIGTMTINGQQVVLSQGVVDLPDGASLEQSRTLTFCLRSKGAPSIEIIA